MELRHACYDNGDFRCVHVVLKPHHVSCKTGAPLISVISRHMSCEEQPVNSTYHARAYFQRQANAPEHAIKI
eukprot:610667-Pyramimonas_sp.AAC.1